jgi:hypothetical protein
MVVRNPSGSRRGNGDQTGNENPSSRTRSKDPAQYEGLCVNCANRANCLFPKPEGGVWHCKDYVEEK